MKIHPAAELFPALEYAELDKLVADIRTRGLLHPIITFEGKILDGRNRYRACQVAGVEPRFQQYDGKDPIGYAVSCNLVRRHLDESQRAMVGARIQAMYDEASTPRDRGGKFATAAKPTGKSREKAATTVNVSPRSVQDATKVLGSGTPALVAAVDGGRIPVSVAVKVAAEHPSIQDSMVSMVEDDGAKPRQLVAELLRDRRVTKLIEIAKGNDPLPVGQTAERYPILYVDPPWRYEHVETESRAIENQYPTLSLEEIKALKVPDLATPDAVLFLWATSPKLAEAMSVLEAWGFTYRTTAVWVKDKIGMGYYFRQRHELLLLATRGSPPTPAPENRPDSIVEAARGQHSAKPIIFAELIERMYPTLPRIELFCRAPREGWAAWGNQAA